MTTKFLTICPFILNFHKKGHIIITIHNPKNYMENGVEIIKNKDNILAIIIYNDCKRDKTEFFTPADFSQQLAFNTHKAGETINAHCHNVVERNIQLTQEVLFMKKGKLKVNIYNNDKTYFDSRILNPGDTILFASGGHGFNFLEDVEMIEVKQGPYLGENDKTWFDGVEKT